VVVVPPVVVVVVPVVVPAVAPLEATVAKEAGSAADGARETRPLYTLDWKVNALLPCTAELVPDAAAETPETPPPREIAEDDVSGVEDDAEDGADVMTVPAPGATAEPDAVVDAEGPDDDPEDGAVEEPPALPDPAEGDDEGDPAGFASAEVAVGDEATDGSDGPERTDAPRNAAVSFTPNMRSTSSEPA
jgi:hypothetical protein